MPEFRYGILGSGRQGTAAAYDLLVRGEAGSVVMADVDGDRAEAAAERLGRLSGSDRVSAAMVSATDRAALVDFLMPLDASVSSASWRFNLAANGAALEAGTHMCDLGGNLEVVRTQLALDPRARERGVCLIPDCGEAPGLASNLTAYALTLLDRADEAVLYDGGLPAAPVPPWNYFLTFNVDGLTTEYEGTTTWRVDGEIVEVPCFDPGEDEVVEFEAPLGRLEAFAASTGSTLPWTIGERIRTLKAKVLRYPGHAAQFRAFRELGLFAQEAVDVGGTRVAPRDLFHRLLEPKLQPSTADRDVVVARVVATGVKDGTGAVATVDLRVRPDERLGFTAMEQATGWHAAIVCHLMAGGRIAPGATAVELAVDPELMMAEVRSRGFELTSAVQPVA